MRTSPARIVLAVVFLAPLGTGCRTSSTASPSGTGDSVSVRRHHPVLLIGLDGVEWTVVLEMLRRNELPVIAGLMQRGAYGKMATTVPTLSPIIWTSIATGMTADKHGIRGFIHKDEEPVDDIHPLYTSNDRKTKAFWNILSDLGLRVCTIGWWMTYPAEPCNGLMISQVNHSTVQANQAGEGEWKGSLVTTEPLEGQVWPPDRQSEMLDLVREVEKGLPEHKQSIFGNIETRLGPVASRLWGASRWALRADAVYRHIGTRLLNDGEPFDLFAIYFGGTDIMGHRFWRYAYPDEFRLKPDSEEVRLLGEMIRKYYAHMDRVVGELITAAPADSVVFLVSDHGMTAGNVDGTFDINLDIKELNSGRHPHAPPAFFVAAGPNIRPLAPDKPVDQLTDEDLPNLCRVFDVLPTVLALLGQPVSRDMDGVVLDEIIEPEFLLQNPVQLVDAFAAPDWHTTRLQAQPQSTEIVERLEQLRALGYLQDDEEPATPQPAETEE